MKIDWERSIQELIAVKREASQADGNESPLPHPPATEAELAAAEAHLGLSLDPQYREFLRHANGWDDFFISTRLFGTDDLLGTTDLMRIARECIDAYVEFNPSGTFPDDEDPLEEWEKGSPLNMISPKDVLPIGFSTATGAMAMIGRGGTSCAGQVIDIYGTAVSRHRDFHAFVRAAIEVAKQPFD